MSSPGEPAEGNLKGDNNLFMIYTEGIDIAFMDLHRVKRP